jgi:hypothetical protein
VYARIFQHMQLHLPPPTVRPKAYPACRSQGTGGLTLHALSVNLLQQVAATIKKAYVPDAEPSRGGLQHHAPTLQQLTGDGDISVCIQVLIGTITSKGTSPRKQVSCLPPFRVTSNNAQSSPTAAGQLAAIPCYRLYRLIDSVN